MPTPTAGLDTHGTGYFLWTPAEYTFEVEVGRNGKCSWFYRDVTRDDVFDGEEGQESVPDRVLDWVAGHHSTVEPDFREIELRLALMSGYTGHESHDAPSSGRIRRSP